VYAIAAIVVTSHYQIWVGTEQKNLACNSQQLLLYQAPVSAMMLIFTIPVFDEVRFQTRRTRSIDLPWGRMAPPHCGRAARSPPHTSVPSVRSAPHNPQWLRTSVGHCPT
jgi:hypothetical protein